jgi:hypothetical protein
VPVIIGSAVAIEFGNQDGRIQSGMNQLPGWPPMTPDMLHDGHELPQKAIDIYVRVETRTPIR